MKTKKPKTKLKILQNTIYKADQSGKIEQTNKNTVVAISNGKKFTVLLKAKDKRLLQDLFRKLKPSKVVSFEEISGIIFPTKKTGYSSISGTEGS